MTKDEQAIQEFLLTLPQGLSEVEKLLEWDRSRWVPGTVDAPHDGEYLCMIAESQECGTVWSYQVVVANRFNKWDLDAKQELLAWRPLPEYQPQEEHD